MRAVTLLEPERIAVADRPEPAIQDPRDVLVEVELAGLCGSDLHPYLGREVGLDPGTIMGHELTGRVFEVGADVGRFRPGDAVVAPFSTSCGACARCRRGVTARCSYGALLGWVAGGRGLQGAQAERVRIPLADSTLVARPVDISPEEALLLGDVASTGYFALTSGPAIDGAIVAVVGLGAVGQAAVLFARHLGAAHVLAFDAIPARLERAERAGAIVFPVRSEDGYARPPGELTREVARATGGPLPTVVVEAVGSLEAARLAVALTETGGHLRVVGVHTEGRFPLTPSELYDRNLTIASGRASVRAHLEELIDLQRRAHWPLASLITHRVTLEEAAHAYRDFADRRGGILKAAFTPR